jgi:RNA polymerase sigma-70 factor (ECF subfamily)
VELAARLRAGDETAMEEIHARYRSVLCRIASWFVDDEAEDVVQEVFLSLWRQRARWHMTSAITAYLFTAVQHRAIDARRRHRCDRRAVARYVGRLDVPACVTTDRVVAANEPMSAATFAFNDGEAALLREDVERAIAAAVKAMPPKCRATFLFYWWGDANDDGRSYADIGAAIGIAPATVRLHLIKARDILDETLRDAGWSNVLRRQRPRG